MSLRRAWHASARGPARSVGRLVGDGRGQIQLKQATSLGDLPDGAAIALDVDERHRLDEAIRALRSLVRGDGEDAVIGPSLDAVSEDGASRMTLAEDGTPLDLLSATAGFLR